MPEEAETPDVRGAYEEGKHRRYSLLFAVNGGAFAVAKLLAELDKPSEREGQDLRDYLTRFSSSAGKEEPIANV